MPRIAPNIFPRISQVVSPENVMVKTHTRRLCTDVFERGADCCGYLSDVVFKRVGNRVKATFNGKPIATTKDELRRQLKALNKNAHNSYNITEDDINKNFSSLKRKDYRAISRISKFFHELNASENKELDKNNLINKINLKMHLIENLLSIIDNLLANPRKFSLEEVNEIISSIRIKNFKYIDALLAADSSMIDNNSIAKCLQNLCLIDETELLMRANTVKGKLEGVHDERIRAFVAPALLERGSDKNKIFKDAFISNEGTRDLDLDKYEMLLDAYHSANNHYSVVNGDVQAYYKYLKNKAISGSASPEEMQELTEIVSVNPNFEMPHYYKPIAQSKSELFNEAVRLEPMKEFIARYSDSEPEMANYLYEQYFLNKIPEGFRDKYIRIRDEFGTQVFPENTIGITEYPDRIFYELKNWEKASKGKAKYPSVFDLSHAKQNYILEKEPASGLYLLSNYSVSVPTQSFSSSNIYGIIRHEMTHHNDLEFNAIGTINGINIDEIINNRQYETELRNAGFSEDIINYAYKNKLEFLAVASEGDYSKYSQEFKDTLIKLGLPEWFFNLRRPLGGFFRRLEIEFKYSAKEEKYTKPYREIPNGIILKNLTGNSLDDVAEWLAESSECELRKVDFSKVSRDEALAILNKIKEEAKETDARTLIQIDNFDRFTTPDEENEKILSALQEFLSSCSEKYKCTVITKADDSAKIDTGIMAVHRFQVQIDTAKY